MEYVPKEGVDYIVDLYAVAGVEQDASEENLKRALNERALEYHPDRLQGVAPEFKEKSERMARLLNRARGILLDTDKRESYDEILTSWEGPISHDGTPAISIERLREVQMSSKSPEEVEAIFAEQVERIVAITGYNPGRLSFLESIISKEGAEISEELRTEYENALLQRDRALAIEEAERSHMLELPDIENDKYVARLGYSEEISERIEAAKEAKTEQLRTLALGSVGAKLALLSGNASEHISLAWSSVPTVELPAYFDEQAAKIQEIARQREEITDKRLSNLKPVYHEEELQTEFKEDLAVGVEIKGSHRWIGVNVDRENDSATLQALPEEVKVLLEQGKFKEAITCGYNLLTVPLMEHIDIQDLIGVAIGKYSDKYSV